MTRPTPESYYYSGQGRLIMGTRDSVTGEAYGLIHVGNCTALSVEIAVENTEHKESMSGLRSTDKTTLKSANATVKFTAESLSPENLAIGLYGESLAVAGATVTDEAHKLGTPFVGQLIPLKHPKVSAVIVSTGANAGAATVVDAAEYSLDADFGTINIIDPTAFTGINVYVDYTYGATKRLDIFTKTAPDEKFLRFEGINTVNDDLVLVNIPRVTFQPLPALQLINEEFGSAEFTGNILLDPLITEGSKYMTQHFITPA